MLSGLPELVAVGALLVVGLAVVGYLRNRTDDPGVTTEVALFLTYLIGVLCVVSQPLAAGLAGPHRGAHPLRRRRLSAARVRRLPLRARSRAAESLG